MVLKPLWGKNSLQTLVKSAKPQKYFIKLHIAWVSLKLAPWESKVANVRVLNYPCIKYGL